MKAVQIVRNTNKPNIDAFEAEVKKKLNSLGIIHDCGKEQAEAIIVLGGDGTILPLAGSEKPLLGINLGHTGYMAELEKDELDSLNALVSNEFIIEKRMMLDIYLIKSGNEKYFESVLNEAVLSKGAVSHMIDIELTSCGKSVSVYSADGLIVATPTGSSAYSMAAGGPIIDPRLEVICITPVCSHSLLSSRPLIFPPDEEIELRFLPTRGKKAFLSADGRKTVEIDENTGVKIIRSEKTTKLIRIKGHTFCDTLYRKLSK
ncbi:MAG: hypothetical protein A2Y17_11985 [Clostridiales bacterium GWF2_38_85]|nr:MAG: hypothetical protein A2Y17_11985 [Clostridiales bacterium GWF2_38_85]HBL85421.1 NAD+ kinase [Clostridiales bacterium]